MENWETNRIKSKRAKLGFDWCICDRAIVGEHGKCRGCGRKKKSNKLKKF